MDVCRKCGITSDEIVETELGTKGPTIYSEQGEDGLCFKCSINMPRQLTLADVPAKLRIYVERLKKKSFHLSVMKIGHNYKVFAREEMKDSTEFKFHVIEFDLFNTKKITDTVMAGTDILYFAQASSDLNKEIRSGGYKWYCSIWGLKYSRPELSFYYTTRKPENAVEMSPVGFIDGRKINATEKTHGTSLKLNEHTNESKKKFEAAMKEFKRRGGKIE